MTSLRNGCSFPWSAWGAILLILPAFFLCAAAPHAALGAPTAGPPVKIKVVCMPYLGYGPLFIARDEGYFAEQGLDVELLMMNDTNNVMPAFIQGDIDVMADMFWPSHLNAIARGARLKIVADKGIISRTGCDYMAFMVRRDLKEKLSSPAGLKGLIFATVQASSSAGYFLEKLLAKGGLASADIRTATVPVPVRIPALENGSIDITFVGEPWVTLMNRRGTIALWMPARELAPDAQLSYLMYGPTLLDKNPEAGRRFMIAYLKAVRRYNEGKTPRNVEILAAATKLAPDLLKEACWPEMRGDGMINVESILDQQSWAIRSGYLDRALTPDQFWDPGFVEHARLVLDGKKP